MKLLRIAPFILLFLAFSCEKEKVHDDLSGSDIPESGWLIPSDEIWNSLHAMDFIQSIDNPTFIGIRESTNLQNDDLVLVFRAGDTVKIYPHKILRSHEIVNDNIDDSYFAVTYCPLTGSGLNWNRQIDGEVTEFGVSGLLYRSNLMPYDRNTTSIWSQMLNKCVNGEQIKTEPKILPLIEMTFATALKSFPDAFILQNDFKSTTDEYPSGERFYGVIIRNNVVLFPYTLFSDSVTVIQDYFNKKEIIVAGSNSDHYIVAFINTTTNPLLKFSAISGELPVIMKDNTGNSWDLFGNAVDGPMKGAKLDIAPAYVAYYWGWLNFYSDPIIVEKQ